MTRTSETHPLRICALAVGSNGGKLGITFCPGKKDQLALTGGWDRDLTLDLDVISAWKTDAVVTLIETHEFALLQVQDLGSAVQARAIAWHHLPIRDVCIPDAAFEESWRRSGPMLHGILEGGGRIVVHCRGGLGRAGLVSALLLIGFGYGPHEAIRLVRSVRPGAIETEAQEIYTHDWYTERTHMSKVPACPVQ